MPHPTYEGTRGFITQQAELRAQAYANEPSEANAMRLHRTQLRLRLINDSAARDERRAQVLRPEKSHRNR